MAQRLAYRHNPNSPRPWEVVVMPRGKKVVGRYKTLDLAMGRIVGEAEWKRLTTKRGK